MLEEEVPLLEAEEPPPKKGRPVLAWFCITFLVVTIVVLRLVRPLLAGTSYEEDVSRITLTMQGRYFVGVHDLLPAPPESLATQLDALDTGGVAQRLCVVVLAGEVAGAAAAQERLDDLDRRLADHEVDPSDEQRKTETLLRRLYKDYEQEKWDAPALTAEDRDYLEAHLGWFGRLALAPAGLPDSPARATLLAPARRTAVTFLAAAGLGLLTALAGLFGLILFIALWSIGYLHMRLSTGRPHGGVYAETFALWMFLFIALGIGMAFVPVPPRFELLLSAASGMSSLIVLVWPVLRGIPWKQVREDIGLNLGKPTWAGPLLGVGTYAAALPLLVVGLILSFFLLTGQRALQGIGDPRDYFGPSDSPSHPIIQEVAQGDLWIGLQVFLVAGLVAPIVEEIMFRGVLYRHIREASAGWGRVLSVFWSAGVVSFIFAVIHPQGFAAVPVLMALALAFSFAREWRGTLIPSMIAHGLNNTAVTCVLLLALAP